MKSRKESDSMGQLDVPIDALYGATTQRAKLNFPISDLRFSRSFIKAIAEIKLAAAKANYELGVLDKTLSASIIKAATEVSEGKHDKEFVVDIFQTEQTNGR